MPAELEGRRITERRLTSLETRFDMILPTLITKADLCELKAELKDTIRAEFAGITKWVAAMLFTIIIGFGGLSLTMMSLFQR